MLRLIHCPECIVVPALGSHLPATAAPRPPLRRRGSPQRFAGHRVESLSSPDSLSIIHYSYFHRNAAHRS